MNHTILRPILIALITIGIFAPYVVFIPFIIEHGLDVSLLAEKAVANRIATFAWLDVIITAIAILIFAFGSGTLKSKQAASVAVLTCLVGPSAGLPLLFYFLLGKSTAKPQESRN